MSVGLLKVNVALNMREWEKLSLQRYVNINRKILFSVEGREGILVQYVQYVVPVVMSLNFWMYPILILSKVTTLAGALETCYNNIFISNSLHMLYLQEYKIIFFMLYYRTN